MSGQQHQTPTAEADPLNAYMEYALGQKQRLDIARDVLRQGLGVTESIGDTNLALIQTGRPELVLSETVELMKVTDPKEAGSKTSNFAPKFKFITGHVETDELDFHDRPVRQPVIISEAELDKLARIPIVTSPGMAQNTQLENLYPVLRGNNHSRKPAFIRMLNLFPGFTKRLVLDMSSPNTSGTHIRLEPELFVAYQIMSRLVDTTDPGVVKDDIVDTWYLCH